jgi:sugar O-acyltransferase (sialic acid O-acetyltransferase NeuD family)
MYEGWTIAQRTGQRLPRGLLFPRPVSSAILFLGMSQKVLIFGVGDFARVACFYLEHDSPMDVAAFTVHEKFIEAKELMGRPVVAWETLRESYPPSEYDMFVAIGYSKVNRNRALVFEEACAAGYEMITYVCSKATTWPDLTVGKGSFIFENNVIQPFVRIGSNTVLWSGNHIGHDSTIGSNVFITSHVVISGNCVVGDNTFIGVNATVRDGITIGHDCVVGAGTVILRDAPPESVYKSISTPAASFASGDLRRI